MFSALLLGFFLFIKGTTYYFIHLVLIISIFFYFRRNICCHDISLFMYCLVGWIKLSHGPDVPQPCFEGTIFYAFL